MACNVLNNAIKDMYYKGIMSETRMINPSKISEFNKANKELKDIAESLYAVKDKGLPFKPVNEGFVKEFTGSTYRRDNLTNIVRANPNMEFFDELQKNYDLLENNVEIKEETEEELKGKSYYQTELEFNDMLASGKINQICKI